MQKPLASLLPDTFRFFALFSATFGQNWLFSVHQFFPTKNYLLWPILSYLAENSAIWQQ
jgi:hypothetical protein